MNLEEGTALHSMDGADEQMTQKYYVCPWNRECNALPL